MIVCHPSRVVALHLIFSHETFPPLIIGTQAVTDPRVWYAKGV